MADWLTKEIIKNTWKMKEICLLDWFDIDCICQFKTWSNNQFKKKWNHCPCWFCPLYVLVPDNIVMTILSERLAQLDCVSRGWVLHGYPRTREQAETLSKEGFVPNRLDSCSVM